jgi:hypothetical protein
MPLADPRRLDRLLYWRGQALVARDFRDEAAQADERRAWHNRAVHQAFGIAAGLEVTPFGKSTARTVAVSPGLAYDRIGREILVRRVLTIAVPPCPPSTEEATFDLLIRLPRSLGCAGSDAELGWRPSSARRSIDDVPVARFGFFEETIERDRRFSAPRTRPYARPRIASGSTLPGNTAWRIEEAPADVFREIAVGASIATRVDTSGAGFTGVPCYFAWLQGSLVDEDAAVFLPAMFTQITDETLTGFTFRIWLPLERIGREGIARSVMARARTLGLRLTRTFAEVQRFAQAQRLAVSWLGCELEHRASLPLGLSPEHSED